MKFKFNQMMHFYKFYIFYRDQSLETDFFYFILFATLITKNIGKEEEEKKKKWRGDLTETIGAYELLKFSL